MTNSLYRPEAVEFQKNRLHGNVIVLPSASHTFILMFILLFVIIFFAWLYHSNYARKETVLGWIEPPSGIVKIYPEAAHGRIEKLFVENGDKVTDGQPLILINGAKVLANGEHLESKLIEEFAFQLTILNEQIVREKNIYQLKHNDIAEQIASSKGDLVMLEQQRVTLERRKLLIDKKASDYKSMVAEGHVSQADLDTITEQQLALSSEYQSLLREKNKQNNILSQLDSQLKLLPVSHDNTIAGLATNISDLEQNIARLDGEREYVIEASRDGYVSGLMAQIGQQANPSVPLLALVPPEDDIEVRLLVPVRAIGFVKTGQTIDIRYDAFSYQKFGLYQGEIFEVSDSIFLPNEVHIAPLAIEEPVYLVKAKLRSQTVTAYGTEVNLKPGMTLSADITLDERTLLEWLLEPILSLKGRL